MNCQSSADLSKVSTRKTSAAQRKGIAQQTGCGRGVCPPIDCTCRKWRQKPSVACISRSHQPTDVNYGLSFERSIIADHKPSSIHAATNLAATVFFDSTEPLERAIVIRTIAPTDRAATRCEWTEDAWLQVATTCWTGQARGQHRKAPRAAPTTIRQLLCGRWLQISEERREKLGFNRGRCGVGDTWPALFIPSCDFNGDAADFFGDRSIGKFFADVDTGNEGARGIHTLARRIRFTRRQIIAPAPA